MDYSMRTERYRLTEWRPLDKGNNFRSLELYDYEKDAGETAIRQAGYSVEQEAVAEAVLNLHTLRLDELRA